MLVASGITPEQARLRGYETISVLDRRHLRHASRRSWLVPLAAAAAILALQAQTGQPASEFGGVVVKELLDNALDAAEKGDEALFVEVVTRTEGEITFVTVTKNGAGIGASRGTRSDCEYDQP